jgi:Flp pilus assembly protein TadG
VATAPRNRQRGTAIVESALSLFVFFTLLFGVMEAGRFMNVQGALTNAAREGARLAVTPLRGTSTLPDPATIEARVKAFMSAAAIPADRVTVVVRSQTSNGTTSTVVTASTPYRVLTVPLFPSLEATISGNAVMRNETSN